MAEKDELPKKGNTNMQANENQDSKSESQNLKNDQKPKATGPQEKKESELTGSIETNESENIDPELNLTLNKAQKREVNVVMSNTFGFGGHNACVIFKKFEE